MLMALAVASKHLPFQAAGALAVDALGIPGAVSRSALLVALAVSSQNVSGIAAHAMGAVHADCIRTTVSVPACLVALAVRAHDLSGIARYAFVSPANLVPNTVGVPARHVAQPVFSQDVSYFAFVAILRVALAVRSKIISILAADALAVVALRVPQAIPVAACLMAESVRAKRISLPTLAGLAIEIAVSVNAQIIVRVAIDAFAIVAFFISDAIRVSACLVAQSIGAQDVPIWAFVSIAVLRMAFAVRSKVISGFAD